MPETLHNCPHCSRSGFTERGLKSHLSVQHKALIVASTPLEVVTGPRLAGGNDAEVAAKLTELVRGAQDGVRRILVAGFFIESIVRQLPHGATRPWLEQHCPEIQWRTVNRWRELARGVMEALGIEWNAAAKLPLPLHDTLALPAGDVPKAMQELRGQIDDLIADKSASQLQLALRAADPKDGGDKQWAKWLRKHHPELIVDGVIPARGKVPKDIRAAFDEYRIKETKRLLKEVGPKAFTDQVLTLAEQIHAVCNTRVLGQASRESFQLLDEARLALGDFMGRMAKGRESAHGRKERA
ncbi:MAG: hypothetical protein U1G08_18050 [Verrucomicrobiota bacterium]|mgnify:CR=1 FL=1